ncbi:bifunctional folylpolyglutamate synthase/dihydrofolate synthase, partial [Planctomycetota bacterium]
SILRCGGLRSGLYASPHVVELRERVVIDGRPVSRAALGAAFEQLERTLEATGAEAGECTFFELMTAVALHCFAQARVDVSVLEVGLGGRLDATNVVEPCVTVITAIGLEHRDKLGDTHADIAGEKAGILKPGIPCVVGRLPAAAELVVRERAGQLGARLLIAPDEVRCEGVRVARAATEATIVTPTRRLEHVRVPLLGEHMAWNAALAVASADLLMDHMGGSPLPDEVVVEGLAQVVLSGRFEIYDQHPTILLDAAHSPDAMAALRRTFEAVFCGRTAVVILGVLMDKDLAGVLAPLEGIARLVVTSPCGSPRERPPREIAEGCRALGFEARVAASPREALAIARCVARAQDDVILGCGSTYLVGRLKRDLDEQ